MESEFIVDLERESDEDNSFNKSLARLIRRRDAVRVIKKRSRWRPIEVWVKFKGQLRKSHLRSTMTKPYKYKILRRNTLQERKIDLKQLETII